jgi:hypothetical protein
MVVFLKKQQKATKKAARLIMIKTAVLMPEETSYSIVLY